ncbi:nuclear transport factor 2 family protein [Phenylobacterium sp.]|uniref:nuclear transport factor 2 family protein n=1 Tax=Phenylobacterium sp. TaxID=1871053 RepID=UPI002F40CC55
MSLNDDLRQWKGPFASPGPAELADRLAASQLVKIYALGIDMRDYDLCRSAFAEGAQMVGTHGSALIEKYLPKVYEGAAGFAATQHNITNQHVTLDGDDALVWSYAIAVHKAAPDSERTDLTMGVQYRDTCRRFPDGWLITARTVVVQWTERPRSAE